jgi:hypothetical protein
MNRVVFLIIFSLFLFSQAGAFILPIVFPSFPTETKQIVWGDKIVGWVWTKIDGNRMIYENANGQTYIGDPNKPVLRQRYSFEFDKERLWI